MMIVAIAHTTSRHTTSTTTTGTAIAALFILLVIMVTVGMVTGSVLSREALVVTVCDSAVAAVDSDWELIQNFNYRQVVFTVNCNSWCLS